MRKLSKILVPAVLAASLAGFAGTATAQDWHNQNPNAQYPSGQYPNGQGWRDPAGNWHDQRDQGRDWHDQNRNGQDWRGRDNSNVDYVIRDQIAQLHARIDNGDRNDFLSPRQANRLRMKLRSIDRQYDRFNDNGLQFRELRSLEAQINSVRLSLRMGTIDFDGDRR